MLEGMMALPFATSSLTKSGVIVFGNLDHQNEEFKPHKIAIADGDKITEELGNAFADQDYWLCRKFHSKAKNFANGFLPGATRLLMRKTAQMQLNGQH